MIGEIILPLALSTVTVWQDEYYFPMLPVLQMGKLKSREGKGRVQSHTAEPALKVPSV